MVGKAIKWGLGAVLVVGVGVVGVGVGVMALNAVTLPMRAASGLAERTLNPANIEATYERFHDRHAVFLTRVQQVNDAARAFAEETNPAEKARLRIELNAIRQSCRETVTQYNADSDKTNRSLFRGWSLPESLSLTACG